MSFSSGFLYIWDTMTRSLVSLILACISLYVFVFHNISGMYLVSHIHVSCVIHMYLRYTDSLFRLSPVSLPISFLAHLSRTLTSYIYIYMYFRVYLVTKYMYLGVFDLKLDIKLLISEPIDNYFKL